MNKTNQLTNPENYDVQKIMFSDPLPGGVVPGTRRILVSTLNKDGTVGDLILPTEKVFSFGVSENKGIDKVTVNGHVLPLCLWNKEAPTKAEKQWTTTFDNIVSRCKDYLLEHKEELELYDITEADFKKFNPLYWKREKGKIVEGTGPTLYAKLIESKKNNKIMTMFFDEEGNPIEPLSLMGKYCYTTGAVKIESIFLGSKISLQVKLYEATVSIVDNGIKPLLPKVRSKTAGSLLRNGTAPALDDEDEAPKPASKKSAEPAGSVPNSDDEQEPEEKKKPEPKKTVPSAKPVVRKVVKKV
jgi:hypothetical protein